MNKQELLNSLNSIRGACTSGSSFQSGVSTGLEIAITEVDKLDELTKAEPLVVPKGLGMWLSDQCLGEEGSFFTNIKNLEDMWVESNFEDFITDNKRELIEVILGTREYEVEEEQKYYVDLETAAYVAKWNGDNQVGIYTDGVFGNDEFEFHLTEQEIKNYDERFWPFAVEVAEDES